MPRKKHTILIAGAGGVVGAAAIEHFTSLPDWEVLALSRRPLSLPTGARHVPVDLSDEVACINAAKSLTQVTHVMFAALHDTPELVAGWRDPKQMAINFAMLRNLLDALQPVAKGLRHITLMQGGKAYGGHIAPVPVPAKERWPRHQHENFYWLQEDLLHERQAQAGWTFTVLRPQLALGYAISSPMNIVAAIGVYAAIQRELRQPLKFPGGGRYVITASDCRLIAGAAEFAGTHEIAANETYNVINGDAMVWQDLWGSIAQRFGMQVGPAEPLELAKAMPAHELTWANIVAKHGLRPLSLEQIIGRSWQFADRMFRYGVAKPTDSVFSPIKLRQHGFASCHDTEESMHYWLERMQAQRLLPR